MKNVQPEGPKMWNDVEMNIGVAINGGVYIIWQHVDTIDDLWQHWATPIYGYLSCQIGVSIVMGVPQQLDGL